MELALVASAVKDSDHAADSRFADKALSLVESQWMSGALALRGVYSRQTEVGHIMLAAILWRHNRLPLAARIRAQRLIDLNLALTESLAPHRVLELRCAHDLGSFESPLPDLRTLSRTTILSRDLNPAFLESSDVYALTHVLMYVTLIGRQSPSLDADIAERSRDLVKHLLWSHIKEGEWDLLAELLLCARWLGVESALIFEGVRALRGAQLARDGGIPVRRALAQQRYESDEAMFRWYYHSTLAATLAAADGIKTA